MNRRCVITVYDKIVTKSATGFETRNETTGSEIFAEMGGVGRNEFYKAAAVGMTPSVTFTVSEADYADQRLIRYGEKVYKVLRTYPIENRKIELVCEGVDPNDD